MKKTKIYLPAGRLDNINIKKYLTIVISMAFLSIFISTDSAQAKEINLENVTKLTNLSRTQNGLGELLINPTLNRVASRKAQHMVKYHYFSHNSPEGIDPWYWFKTEGYEYKYAGENLAINYASAEDQQSAWMKSPTHRKNILNQKYQEIGIATASGYINNKPASVTVQVFGTPRAPINTTTLLRPNNKLTQATSSIPYVLGEQMHYPVKTQYLSKVDSNIDKIQKSGFSIGSYALNAIKKQTHNLIWVTILILGIVIIRDMVLRSIASPAIHKHSMTNLILLLMLWSVFIGM